VRSDFRHFEDRRELIEFEHREALAGGKREIALAGGQDVGVGGYQQHEPSRPK